MIRRVMSQEPRVKTGTADETARFLSHDSCLMPLRINMEGDKS